MGNLRDIDALIANLCNQVGNACLTVIIPLSQRDGEDVNRLRIHHVLTRTKQFLQEQHSTEMKQIDAVLEELIRKVHYDRHCSGIGLYISAGVREVFHFRFSGKEKIILADKFDITDLLYQAQYDQPGYILQLTGKGVRLFLTGLQEAKEITDGHFPLAYSDDYEYNPPAPTASYTGYAVTQQFEKDKSWLKETRYENFLRQVDHHLAGYLNAIHPLVVMGPPKAVTAFATNTTFRRQLAGVLPDNFPRSGAFKLHQLTRHFFEDQVKHQIDASIRLLVEKTGVYLAVGGIADCWNAAAEGKGLLLLVEKDYAVAGFVEQDDEAHLHLKPPKHKHRILTNAVNDLIYTVLDKNGKVLIGESGSLTSYNHIGLIKRYA